MRETSNPVFRSLPKQRGGYAQFGTGVAGAATQYGHQADPYAPYVDQRAAVSRPLTIDDVKPRLLGHWGTTSGLNFIYTHLNRLIVERDLDMIYIIGPGHGGPGLVAHTYLEGSYTEIYPYIEQNKDGMRRLFSQFSWQIGRASCRERVCLYV